MDNLIDSTQAVLRLTADRWLSLTQSLPAGLVARAPAPGEWSALECLQHLVDTERDVFPVRVRAFLAGRDVEAYFPDSQGTRPAEGQNPADLAAEFARLRADSLKLLDTVTVADLDRRANHTELGRVTLSQLLHEWGGHDLMHTVQAERALMQPFILGCGPWQVYFKDHLASPQPAA